MFSSNLIYDNRIKLDLDTSDITLDVDTIIPIGLITNELITNCLKYAYPNNSSGTITVRLDEKDNQLQLQIKDNGEGMSDTDYSNLGQSFGFKMIKAFLVRLDGEMTIDRESGTSIQIGIKDYKLA